MIRVKTGWTFRHDQYLMNSALLSCHLELEDEEDFVFGELIKRVCSEPLFLLGSTECEVSGF